MIMEESYGDPTCINKRDGGAGLIHMQPATAKKIGLEVYQDNNDVVSEKHAKELTKLIKNKKYNLDSLKVYDDRFNEEKLLEAIAKMIKEYYDKKFQNWDAAIAAVHTGPNGVYNEKGQFTKRAKRYLERLKKWDKCIKNEKIMRKVEENFNRRNYDIGLNFDDYVGYFWDNYKK